MCPHFGFCDVLSLSGKKSDFMFEFCKLQFKFPMGNRRLYASLDFFQEMEMEMEVEVEVQVEVEVDVKLEVDVEVKIDVEVEVEAQVFFLQHLKIECCKNFRNLCNMSFATFEKLPKTLQH